MTVKCCKFHAKTQIEDSNDSTKLFNLKFIGCSGRCEVLMGYPESVCGNKAYYEYDIIEIQNR